MSFLVNKLADHAGELLADKLKSALGAGDDDDKDKEKDKDRGFLSIFKGDKDKEDEHEDKGGMFSFGNDKKKKDDDDDDDDDGKGGFFSKLFKKDDDEEEGVHKKSGFAGLFSEPDKVGNADCQQCEDTGAGELDLSDLMAVAKETS